MKHLFIVAAISAIAIQSNVANAAYGDKEDFTTTTLNRVNETIFSAAKTNLDLMKISCEYIQDHEEHVDAEFVQIEPNTSVCKLHVENYWGEEGRSTFISTHTKSKIFITHFVYEISASQCLAAWDEQLKIAQDSNGKTLPEYVITRNSMKTKDGKKSVYVNYEDKNENCVMKFEFAK